MCTSNCNKFTLLLWKNWKLLWNHKIQLLLELILPVVFCALIFVIRAIASPKPFDDPTIYQDYSIDLEELDFSMDPHSASPIHVWQLAYSPKNEVLESLMAEVNLQLNLNIPPIALENAEKLEKHMQKLSEQCICGIQFTDNLKDITKLPDSITYTLRFPSELRTYSLYENWYTDLLRPVIELSTPRNYYDDGGNPGYLREGFTAIQHQVAMAFLKKLANENNIEYDLPSFVMQRTPFPPYLEDYLSKTVEKFVPLIILICFIHQAAQIVKRVTHEREKQLKEIMNIMGISNWLHWLSWFVMSIIIMSISIIFVVLLLRIEVTNAAILGHSNILLILLIFHVYSIATITFCFLLSTLFCKASTATGVTCLIWFIFFMPFQTTISHYEKLDYISKLLLLLFFNTALAYAMTLVLRFEVKGVGLQWDNFNEPVNENDNLTVATILLMMLLSAVIHMLFALYFEKVIVSGNLGVAEKWYFPFSKEYWMRYKRKKNYDDDDEYNDEYNDDEPITPRKSGIENDTGNNKVGVSIKNLTKTFGTRTVVNNLSMDLKENEITVLLGHNGAGKTTTVSMLTGLITPTSGRVYINGYNLKTNLEGARSSLGLCPQYNILFDDLTVRDHIIFYSKLKGLKSAEVENEIKKYLKILEMEHKMHTKSKNLSGGMQRKLSVVAALFGGTKVVFLDEPSSGMDPAARRTLWDLLQLEKSNRTILLSTHFMDEADVLGDKIAILAAGELQCFGTSFFLKKKYANGYHLICEKEPDCDPGKVTALLRNYVPDIQISKNVGSELSYQLSDEYSQKFPEIFSSLEKQSAALKLRGFGISIPTLDEVFMLFGAEKHVLPEDFNEHLIRTCRKFDDNGKKKNETFCLSQWRAMFLKKWLYAKRNYYIILIQLILIIFFILTTGFILKSQDAGDLPPLLMTLKNYSQVNAILASIKPEQLTLNIIDNYDKYVKSFGNDYKTTKINEDFVNYYLKIDTLYYTEKYFIGAEFFTNLIRVFFNNELYHTLPLSFNVMHNALLRTFLKDNKYSIAVINHPLPKLPSTKISDSKQEQLGTGFQLSTNINFCMAFVTALYVFFLIKERESRARLLQFVSGVRLSTFWISHLIFDIMTFILLIIIGLVVLSLFQLDGFKKLDELLLLFFILFLFGLATIPFMYTLSVLFTEPVSAFSYLAIFSILLGAAFIIVYILRTPILEMEHIADIISYVFGIFPSFALPDSINNLYITAMTKSACLDLCKYVPQVVDCTIDEMCHINETCCVPTIFSTDPPGNGRNIIAFLIVFIICVLLLFISNLQVVGKINMIFEQRKRPPLRVSLQILHDDSMDDDVKEEYFKIDNMTDEELNDNNLVLIKVTKYYGNFLAVNQVSFSVGPSECFGLLGINGAGKTTLFKMMTGDIAMTYGNGYVNGKNIRKEMHKIYRNTGYCPQFDALLEDLTGRELLRIFGLLRGIPEKKIDHVSDIFAYGFGFERHIDKPIKTYSGGNKRKLSTTIAMLGCPSVIYLDEPTSGMDPAARRQLWNMVEQMRLLGKSIVLTSHSMEECEALCTRLAIMVNGQFKCIGPIQHLKNKFAKGLILKLKINKNVSPDKLDENENDENKKDENDANENDNIARVMEFISTEFPEAILVEQFQELLTYTIPISNITWSEIFNTLERNKEELQIQDYTIAQTSLEEIFLGFTSYQKEEAKKTK